MLQTKTIVGTETYKDNVGRYLRAAVTGDTLEMEILREANDFQPETNMQHKQDVCFLVYKLTEIIEQQSPTSWKNIKTTLCSSKTATTLLRSSLHGPGALGQSVLDTAFDSMLQAILGKPPTPLQNAKPVELGILYNLHVLSLKNASDALYAAVTYLDWCKTYHHWESEAPIKKIITFLKESVVPESDQIFGGFLDSILEYRENHDHRNPPPPWDDNDGGDGHNESTQWFTLVTSILKDSNRTESPELVALVSLPGEIGQRARELWLGNNAEIRDLFAQQIRVLVTGNAFIEIDPGPLAVFDESQAAADAAAIAIQTFGLDDDDEKVPIK